MLWLQRQRTDGTWGNVDGPFTEIMELRFRWALIDTDGDVLQTKPVDVTTSRHLEIARNELLTYAQAGNIRLQQLVELFGDMVQDKPEDPDKHIRRVDALAEMIRNQIQELQVLTQPIK